MYCVVFNQGNGKKTKKNQNQLDQGQTVKHNSAPIYFRFKKKKK